jgi:hypothetical protein
MKKYHIYFLSYLFFIGNRFKKSICLFLNPIVQLLLFCIYTSVIPIKYVYTYKWANWTIVKCHHLSFIGQRFKIDSYLFNFILGSTTICDSVQNEVEPRGIQDGTMVLIFFYIDCVWYVFNATDKYFSYIVAVSLSLVAEHGASTENHWLAVTSHPRMKEYRIPLYVKWSQVC